MIPRTQDPILMQRMAALDNANEVRSYRARMKRDIKAGRISVLDVLLESPEQIATMQLFDLMMAMPKYGRIKVNQVLRQCRISPAKPIGTLSERQRAEIVYRLRR